MEEKSTTNKEISIHFDRVKKLILDKGYSMRGFCDVLGRSNIGFVQTLQRGTMDIRTLYAVADQLEMNPFDLLWHMMSDEERTKYAQKARAYLSVAAEPAASYGPDAELSTKDLIAFLRANRGRINDLMDGNP